MEIQNQSQQLKLEPNDGRQLATLCGPCDVHLRQIEQRLGITIKNRGNAFQLIGEDDRLTSAGKLLGHLYQEVRKGTELTAEMVHLSLQDADVAAISRDTTDNQYEIISTCRQSIKPRGKNQNDYVRAIHTNDINFAVGPAGTGKTYLAVACAVEALEQERISRILLARPAIEAGEKLGFLPGDVTQKVDPYLRPLYDALYEILGFERVARLLERNIIEVAPLAYMRGRTLNDMFIILDEGQNTTIEQMKMFLTRVGFGSTVVVTGDVTQVDLPNKMKSGLRHVLRVLTFADGISCTHFSPRDVVRHPLVQRIVEAYELHEGKHAE